MLPYRHHDGLDWTGLGWYGMLWYGMVNDDVGNSILGCLDFGR